MIKVVLFGMGHLGKWHAQKIHTISDAEFVGVVDPSPLAEEKLKELGISVPRFDSLEAIDVDFHAAIVATPTSLHHEICKKLISSGKHVFCEKPMTSTYEQALELKELVDNRKIIFQVGHSERFHQVWEEIRSKTEYFKGKPLVSLNRQAPFKGRATDVDVVQDLMIHDIDILLFLLGETPESVQAFGKKIRTDKWDYSEASFDFASGARATIRVGRNYTREVREFEVLNEAGCLLVDLFGKKYFEANGKATGPDDFVNEESYPARDHLLEEQKLFYRAIKTGEKPFVDIEAGVKAVYIVGKVLESMETEKAIEC
ncbi:MAG: Gfo/Idh/MocA family oxidoreductase [Halobacteriovoraceae bacterium]|nr:Gfo/Idh/MocA family oxidoreductase [Halobacteriovoraceae bacterium]